MNTGRDRSGWQVASHELQQCHLRGRILHGHSIRLELESRIAPDVLSIVGIRKEGLLWVVEMGVEDLLGQGQSSRITQHTANFAESLEEFGIRRSSRFNVWFVGGGAGLDGRESSGIASGEQGPRSRTLVWVVN